MKVYQFEGKQWVESGEVREPIPGEIYLQHPEHDAGQRPYKAGRPHGIDMSLDNGKRKILTPKEEVKMSEEYDIPVLVKAEIAGPSHDSDARPFAATVILCRRVGDQLLGPKGANKYNGGKGWNFAPHGSAWLTQAQVEAEQAKLKAKADPLPAPVRAALEAADLGCRRDGVAKLIEAMYLNPPKAKE